MAGDREHRAPEPRRAARSDAGAEIVRAILDAAGERIARDGYEATTTNAIATRAGISIGSLYQYFPDKHAIVAELARRLERRGLELAMQRAAASGSLDAKAITSIWVGVMTDPALGAPALRRALLLEVPPLWILEATRDTDGGVEATLVSVITSLGSGLRAADPEMMAFVSFHAVEGVVETLLRERAEDFGDPRFRAELFRLVWSYAAPEGADLTPPEAPPPISADVPPLVVRQAPARPAPKHARGVATVERILDAAGAVLLEAGHAGLKARRIAKAAGVSPSALYRHFESVPAILTELARRRDERALRLVGAALERGTDDSLRGTIRGVVEALAGPLHGTMEERYAMLAHVPHAWFLDARADVTTGTTQRVAAAKQTHAASLREGEPEWMGFVAAHAIQTTIEAAILRRPDVLPQPLVEELTEMIYRYLRRPPEHTRALPET